MVLNPVILCLKAFLLSMHNKKIIALACLVILCQVALAQQSAAWYNADSLLRRVSANKKFGQIIKEAEGVYKKAHLDSTDVSLVAFEVACLEKKLIETKQVRLKELKQYKKKQIISVVDYTRPGNRPRMITVDLKRRKILYESLVTQGGGTGNRKNDKYALPIYFSNANGSECSSLGMTLATKGTHPDNPCHLCRFTLSRKHDCVIVMEGLESGINDHILERDVELHTTGSLNFGTDSLRRLLKIKDTLYCLIPDSCKCQTSRRDGTPKRTDAYATQCGIADNNGYMGQSNGCLVLPEETHIGLMNAIKGGSLIFIYSNVITGETDYFRNSPIIRKLVKLSERKMRHR